MPADDREAESHRLAPYRPVRLARSRKHEDVGCLVESRDLLERERICTITRLVSRSARDETAHVPRSVYRPHRRRRGGASPRRPEIARTPRARGSFLRQPVGDGKERGSPPFSKVRWRTCWRRRYVPSRGTTRIRERGKPPRRTASRGGHSPRSGGRLGAGRADRATPAPSRERRRDRSHRAAGAGRRSQGRQGAEREPDRKRSSDRVEQEAFAPSFSHRRSTAAPRAASGNGHSGNERNGIRAECARAACAIRRWYR